jgi:hypothetical protein
MSKDLVYTVTTVLEVVKDNFSQNEGPHIDSAN